MNNHTISPFRNSGCESYCTFAKNTSSKRYTRIVIDVFKNRVVILASRHVQLTYISRTGELECVRRIDVSLPRDGGYIYPFRKLIGEELPFPEKSLDEQRKCSYSPPKGKHRPVLGVRVLLSTPGSSRPRVYKHT